MATVTARRVLGAAAKVEWSAITDRELLRRFVAENEQAAFSALVRRHTALVLGVCRRCLPAGGDAEDACQAVFLVLARQANSARWQSSVANWLYVTARKVSRDARVAAERRARREERAAVPEAVSSTDRLTGTELLAALDDELDRLPAAYREPLVLCYLEGLSREEAAARLGVPAGTVKIRLERGRKKLADALATRGVTAGLGLLTLAVTSAAGASPPRLLESILAAVGGSPCESAAALARGVAMNGVLTKAKLLVVAAVMSIGVGLMAMSPSPADPPKPDQKLEKPAAKADLKAELPKPVAEKATKPTVVSGMVVGPDGKAVAGATVELIRSGRSLVTTSSVTKLATTGDDGMFNVELPKDTLHFWLIARKPGFGVAWVEPQYPSGAMPTENVKLQLVKDQPITGRVLDTEGKPVAGMTITVPNVIEPLSGDLDKLLAGSTNRRFGTVGQWEKVLFLTPEMGTQTTDKDGKFEIEGLGADRVVAVVVHGKGMARQSGFVFARAGVNVEPLNQKPDKFKSQPANRTAVFYPPTPTFVVTPGCAVEGVVTNKATGKPIPDCEVHVNTGFWDWTRVKTDSAGRYRLNGLTKGMQHLILVRPSAGAAVFGTSQAVSHADLVKPLSLDFALAKGAVFTGRVIDQETKQPVVASFQINPVADNDFVKKPEYAEAADSREWKGNGSSTFRIITVPGKSKVNISVVAKESLHGQPFHPYRDGQTLDIDLPESGEKEHIVELDRGKTAAVSVVDEAGKPVTGTAVSGITYTNQDGVAQPRVYKLPATESNFTVYGLGEKEKRRLIVLQPEKKLVAFGRIGAGAKETMTLVPFQSVKGCFTDTDGKPMAGLTVGIDYEGYDDERSVNEEGYGEGRLIGEEGGFKLTAKTDAEGKFTIPTVVPGLPFTIAIRKGNSKYGGMPQFGRTTVEVGMPLDLGTRKLEIVK